MLTCLLDNLEPPEIKLPAGHAVVYPSSALHQVAQVSRGERLAAVIWVRSHVRNPARREILNNICRMREKLAKLHPGRRGDRPRLQDPRQPAAHVV